MVDRTTSEGAFCTENRDDRGWRSVSRQKGRDRLGYKCAQIWRGNAPVEMLPDRELFAIIIRAELSALIDEKNHSIEQSAACRE